MPQAGMLWVAEGVQQTYEIFSFLCVAPAEEKIKRAATGMGKKCDRN